MGLRLNKPMSYCGTFWVGFCYAMHPRFSLTCLAASGRIQVAQKLLVMLPPELASFAEPEMQATEYLHYRQFFVIWETLERVVECQALEVSQLNRDSKRAWLHDYKVRYLSLITLVFLFCSLFQTYFKHRIY